MVVGQETLICYVDKGSFFPGEDIMMMTGFTSPSLSLNGFEPKARGGKFHHTVTQKSLQTRKQAMGDIVPRSKKRLGQRISLFPHWSKPFPKPTVPPLGRSRGCPSVGLCRIGRAEEDPILIPLRWHKEDQE